MKSPPSTPFSGCYRAVPRASPAATRSWALRDLEYRPFVLTPKLERGYTSAQQWTPGRGGAIQLSEIKVRENETFESALRRFNKKIKQNGVLSEVRRREHYEKPSVKRKKKIAAARKRRARTT